MIRKFSAVKRELCDIGFQHSRNLVFPQSIAGLQQDFGVFFAEGFISHLLKNSEHGPVIHVVPVDHGILALCGTIPLKKEASGSAPFSLVGTPQIALVGFFVDFAVSYTGKSSGTGESFPEPANTGEQVNISYGFLYHAPYLV